MALPLLHRYAWNLMASEPSLERNVQRIIAFRVTRWFMVLVPVIVPFFQSKGLSLTQIFVLQASFAAVLTLCEVPSGYLSDRWSRKGCLVLGAVLCFFGFASFGMATGFSGLLLGEVLLGISASLVSGSDMALLYDSLLALKREEEFPGHNGRFHGLGSMSEAMAAVLGGLLAGLSLNYPIWAQVTVLAPSIWIAVKLKEPPRNGAREQDSLPAPGPSPSLGAILREVLTEKPRLRFVILFTGVVSAQTLLLVWMVQPVLARAGVPLAYLGWIWAALMGLVSTGNLWSPVLQRRWGTAPLLVLGAATPIAAYFVLALDIGLWCLAPIAMVYLTRGLFLPAGQVLINGWTGSDRRATVLSLQSLLMRLLFVFLGPAMGHLAERYSYSWAFAAMALGFLLLEFSLWFFLGRGLSLEQPAKSCPAVPELSSGG